MLKLRIVSSMALVALLGAGSCGAAPPRTTTPSGESCADMAVVPAGADPGRPLHRLQPVGSKRGAAVVTEADRLASLRAVACAAGGDAVIEAVNEEVRLPDGTFATVASGTAVIWTGPAPTASAAPVAPAAPGDAAL